MLKPGRRFPKSVYGSGSEPDPRFSLANERTFLAWIRTALALLAAGVALAILGTDVHPGFRLAASAVLVLAGIGTPIQAWVGWMRSESAMRSARPLPSPTFAGPMAAAVVVAGVLAVVGTLL